MEKEKRSSDTRFNYFFAKGKVNYLFDISAGSSGKGLLSANLIKHSNNCRFAITSNAPNASHYVEEKQADGTIKTVLFKCLPSAAFYHEKLEAIYVTQGSVIEIEQLFHELELTGCPPEKIRIHYKTGVVSQIDADFEAGLCDFDGNYFDERRSGTLKGGTTASGSGAVRAKKCLRKPDQKLYAYEYDELKPFLCDTEREIMQRLRIGQAGLHEIAQGFALSYGLSYNKRNSTARNCTVAAALDDSLLPPSVVGNVMGNARTFPIKIHNYKYELIPDVQFAYFSKLDGVNPDGLEKAYDTRLFEFVNRDGDVLVMTRRNVFLTGYDMKRYPMLKYNRIESYSGDWYRSGWDSPELQREISWEDVETAYGKTIDDKTKFTSLTLLPRRVATFSSALLRDAINYNRPPEPYKFYVAINFVNWLDSSIEGFSSDDVMAIDSIPSASVRKWLKENVTFMIDDDDVPAQLALLETSRFVGDFIPLL